MWCKYINVNFLENEKTVIEPAYKPVFGFEMISAWINSLRGLALDPKPFPQPAMKCNVFFERWSWVVKYGSLSNQPQRLTLPLANHRC